MFGALKFFNLPFKMNKFNARTRVVRSISTTTYQWFILVSQSLIDRTIRGWPHRNQNFDLVLVIYHQTLFRSNSCTYFVLNIKPKEKNHKNSIKIYSDFC